MKKLNFIALMACVALFLASCNGSSSDDDTSEGNWVTANDMPSPSSGRFYAVSFTIGDSVAYVGTGNDGNTNDSALSDFWRFDGGWKSVAPIPVGRQQAVAFSIGGKGYVGTGTGAGNDANSGKYLTDFYAYDAASNTWSKTGQIPDLPGPGRQRATAFAVNNKGYVVAGAQIRSSIFYLDMYSYNPSTNSWTEEDALPNDARYGASSFVYDGMGYVVGGINSGGQLSTYFFRFDPTTSKWDTHLRQIYNRLDSTVDDDWTDIKRVDGVTLVMGSKVYYMSGATSATSYNGTGGSPSTTAWAYDPANDTWDQRAGYSTDRTTGARWGAVGFTINGNGYIGTGWNGNIPAYNNFDQYFPNQDLNTND